MRLLSLLFCLVLLVFCPHPAPGNDRKSLPPYPMVKERSKPEGDREKARKLFNLAFLENKRLRWDECLAGQAARRAKSIVRNGRFEHKDPATGKNPAWGMVAQCHKIRCAGENLSKGNRPVQAIHNALMESPSHRRNILDRRFTYLGVGCYDEICVELFAGL